MDSKQWPYHNKIMMSHVSIQAFDRVFLCRMHVTNPAYNIMESAEVTHLRILNIKSETESGRVGIQKSNNTCA